METCKKNTLNLPIQDDIVGYLLENSSIVFITALSHLIREGKKGSKPSFWKGYVSGTVSIDTILLLQTLISHKLFKKVPYFNNSLEGNRPNVTLKELAYDYITNYIPANVMTTLVSTAALNLLSTTDSSKSVDTRKWSIVGFFIRLGIFRIIADINFYIVHYLLHTKQFYFLHKRHHEHKKVALVTNYHFHPIDLFLEGFVPGFFAIVAMGIFAEITKSDFFLCSDYESSYFMTLAIWYEAASHTGKQCPGMTSSFPPLSIFFNRLFPGVFDKDNALFHERHHNLVKANYGITTWIDRLVGTCDMRSIEEVMATKTKGELVENEEDAAKRIYIERKE